MNAEQLERKRAVQRECMRRLRERMTPDQLEADRKAKREHARRVRIERPEAPRAAERRYGAAHREERAFKDFCRYHDDPRAAQERLDAWKKANPERARELKRESRKRRATRPGNKLANIKRDRRRYIRDVKDHAALGQRIAAHVEGIVPRTLPEEARTAVIAAMAEAIYIGELPTKPRAGDVKSFVTAHFRMFTNYGPVSLDDVIGEDGFTLGQALGVY